MKTLLQARTDIMRKLSRCPVCGAQPFAAERCDGLESVTFVCTATFFLRDGAKISVSQECPGPSYVAIDALEKEAADLLASGPHDYWPSVTHMGDCTICGNREDHPNHSVEAVAA